MTNLKLTRRERMSALISMVIGDASLWKHPESSKYCLSICHSAKQRELVELKREILSTMFHYSMNIYNESARIGEKVYPSLRIRTRSHRIFNVLRKRMYKNGKRIVTRALLDRLTPFGLAIWYMDDGNHNVVLRENGTIRQRSIRLAVCDYSTTEVDEIVRYFQEVWDIKWNVNYRNGKNPVLRAGAQEAFKFCNLISPYVIPAMRYKLLREYQVEECGAS